MSDLIVALDARLLGTRNTGDTAYWRGLIRGLAGVNQEFHILLYSNASKPDGVPEDPRFDWVQLRCANDRWFSLVAFPRDAIQRGAQVIHTQYNLSPLVGNRGITTVHDVSFFIGPQWFKPRDRLILRNMIPGSCARASRIFTVSETSKREIEHYIPTASGKVVVTPNALSDDIVRVSTEDVEATLRRFGVQEPYVLTVGTRWPRKNMSLAIEAANLAGIPIVVTGQSGWEDDFTGCILTGYIERKELNALYQGAAAYLAPSFHEGFGIPLLEAFALGCPVICSAGGAMPEVAGGAATVVPNFELSSWASAIKTTLSQPPTSEQLATMLTRVDAYDWVTTAKIALEQYRQVAFPAS